MVDLTKTETRTIEEAVSVPRGFGYVLDFSDRTMGEFFEDELGVDIYSSEFLVNGSSKRNCLTTFLLLSNQQTALYVLKALWEIREGILAGITHPSQRAEAAKVTGRFKRIIDKLEGKASPIQSEGVDKFVSERTLEELVADIERNLEANKPEVALDHLHTYCVKKITHLLKTRGVECEQDEPLHSRFGKYRKELIKEQNLHEFFDRALKSSIGLLESFNDLRNNHSLAHDNEILGPVEARFVFSNINAILVLIRALESNRYYEE